ncbi:transfer/carrier protein [Lithospermum erythrorhizon]|uniref:ferroxidase n=1 Tax=Lithospermum erythrorhizon TaxID=34254 RepID=A0AAV3QQV1_LITER
MALSSSSSWRKLIEVTTLWKSVKHFSSIHNLCSIQKQSPLILSDSHHFLEPSILNPDVSRSFCSRASSNFDQQGPAAIDYSSLLHPDEYQRLADSTLHDLQDRLEEYGDSVDIDGFDVDYANEVLTLKLGTLGTYVINKQTPNRQIWMSSPVSGPSRYDWDQSAQAWIYRRTKANLHDVLQKEMEQLCGQPISLR